MSGFSYAVRMTFQERWKYTLLCFVLALVLIIVFKMLPRYEAHGVTSDGILHQFYFDKWTGTRGTERTPGVPDPN